MTNVDSKVLIDLSKHVAALKKAKGTGGAASGDTTATTAKETLIFWGSFQDKQYLSYLKPCVQGYNVFLNLNKVTTFTEVKMFCKAKHTNKIITTSTSLLAKLLYWDKRAAPSLSNYMGSYFHIPDTDIEVVVIPSLKQLVTVPHIRFLTSRYVSKLTSPDSWFQVTEFRFSRDNILTPANQSQHFDQLQGCFLISVDIETFKENATIRCLSYTGFYIDTDSGRLSSKSLVLPLDSEANLAIMRKWNWELRAPKVLQNGKYDISYLSRYSAPLYNYLFDTATLFHSWYSELPKDLGFLNAFFVRKAMYWKDLSETNDLYEYYKYNALDTWGTGNAFLAMLLEAPKYAIDNYMLEFPLIHPCHLCEMTGIERDTEVFAKAKSQLEFKIDSETKLLSKMLAIPEGEVFNPASPPQMKSLLKILGCGDLKDTSASSLKKARFRHPFNARIINMVLEIRQARKLVSTYLTAKEDFHRLDGTGNRVLYALNPHGTDTARLVSKSHHFWTGVNIQQIPRGPAVKQTLKADPGWLLAEVDLEQAESRDTAYISGDETLITNVETSPDFHCANASAFFGIPFDQLFDVATGEKLNKAIRDLAKNVNHGANYLMGAGVLIETMGEANIVKAKQLLGLPKLWSYKAVAEYLLEQFHKTYPKLGEVFYPGVVDEVMRSGRLESKAWHHDWNWSGIADTDLDAAHNSYEKEWGEVPHWTRACFANPVKNKSAKNAYVAHVPQNLNAQTLNKAFISVFYEIVMHPEHGQNIKPLAQIHDSILFEYRIGKSYICDMVKERMEVPITIKGYDQNIRTFVVPAGIKMGRPDTNDIATYWSETE